VSSFSGLSARHLTSHCDVVAQRKQRDEKPLRRNLFDGARYVAFGVYLTYLEGIQDVPSFDPSRSAHPEVRELAERQGYLTPESQPPPSPPTETPTIQQSPHAGIEPEDVGAIVNPPDEFQQGLAGDWTTEYIEELIEDAIRGAPGLMRMFRAIRSDPTSEATRPILFHDELVEPGGRLVGALTGHSNLLASNQGLGDSPQGFDGGHYSMDPLLGANYSLGETEVVVNPFENTTDDVAVAFQFDAPMAEVAINSESGEYEELERFMVLEEDVSAVQSMEGGIC
jgi:hypothetical protein